MPPRVRVVGREPGVEQDLLLLSALLAIACLVGGVYLAEIRADPHWLNRAGAAITASQCVVLAAEFARRSRLASLAPVTVDRDRPAEKQGQPPVSELRPPRMGDCPKFHRQFHPLQKLADASLFVCPAEEREIVV